MQFLFVNLFLINILLVSSTAHASTKKTEQLIQSNRQVYEQCVFSTIKTTTEKITLKEVESQCEKQVASKVLNENEDKDFELGALVNRLIKEKKTSINPYILTPHLMNYILPVSITNAINRDAYEEVSTWQDDLKNTETKFQISLKVPLLSGNLFNDVDQVFFAFTLKSWWQIYADEISRPFRETNYQPEFFYLSPINFHPFHGNSILAFGLVHQSNGHSQLLSRSWNRLYVNYLYEKNNFALSLRPWYRIPESEKTTPDDGVGDDNPDIIDYMGHFDLSMVYKYTDNIELTFKGRNNFATHKGFVEVGMTFPLWGKLKGYTQFSSGYGDSLIDYNYNQKRFGIGIALSSLL